LSFIRLELRLLERIGSTIRINACYYDNFILGS
jgi:hypothetical protein